MCDWWLSTELGLTVSLLAASTSIIPLSRFWQSGGIKWGIWNTPSFTFSSRFLRLSSSNGRAPWHTQRWQGWKKTKKRLVQNMHCTQRKTCEWCRSDRDIFIKELRGIRQGRRIETHWQLAAFHAELTLSSLFQHSPWPNRDCCFCQMTWMTQRCDRRQARVTDDVIRKKLAATVTKTKRRCLGGGGGGRGGNAILSNAKP